MHIIQSILNSSLLNILDTDLVKCINCPMQQLEADNYWLSLYPTFDFITTTTPKNVKQNWTIRSAITKN